MGRTEQFHENDADVPVFDGLEFSGDSISDQGEVCIVFVILDDFGRICGTNGHPGGKKIYGELLDQLEEVRPERANWYRLPRSGFLFALQDRDRDSIQQFAQNIVNLTKSSLEIDGYSMNVSVSIGVAQSHDATPEKLLDRAHFAAFSAAEESGSAYEFYDSNEADRITEEISLKNDLYDALENDEFKLVYQPVVSLEDFSIVGAEALIRWDHPDRGTISPGTFIPLAEKSGQILFLDRWVLRNAVRQAAEWCRRFDSPFQLGVNISAWQFRDDFLLKKLGDILDEFGFPRERLVLEVTETSVMKDVERTVRVLEDLKELGIQVALDDFGTGHATFEYLSRFPIDELKIDRSFLDFNDVYKKNQELIDIMIQTGQRIGTQILAEGIETEEQLHFLRNRGCETAQGFLFARPQSPENLRKLIENKEKLYRQPGESRVDHSQNG